MPDYTIRYADADQRNSAREPFDHLDWVFEAKFDGFRAAADTVRGRLISRSGHRMQRFKAALMFGRRRPTYVAFDLLIADGDDLRALPLKQRKGALARVGAGAEGWIALTNGLVGEGCALYRAVVDADLEGIVAKRLADAYHPKQRAGTRSSTRPTRSVAGVPNGLASAGQCPFGQIDPVLKVDLLFIDLQGRKRAEQTASNGFRMCGLINEIPARQVEGSQLHSEPGNRRCPDSHGLIQQLKQPVAYVTFAVGIGISFARKSHHIAPPMECFPVVPSLVVAVIRRVLVA